MTKTDPPKRVEGGQDRRRIGRSATKASARRNGLPKPDAGAVRHARGLSKRLGGAQNQIVASAGCVRGSRPGNRQGEIGRRRDLEAVAYVGENGDRIEIVITVSAPPQNVQRKIDLGGGEPAVR